MRVLVVEDDQAQLDYLQIVCSEIFKGDQITYKRYAESALDHYADVAVLDCNFKAGCSGIDLAKELKTTNENCIVVFYSIVDEGKKYIDMSVEGFDVISKDAEAKELIRSLRQAKREAQRAN